MATFPHEQVAAYLGRVGYSCCNGYSCSRRAGAACQNAVLPGKPPPSPQLPPPSLCTLVHLQRAHLLALPFENLSLRLPAAAAQHGCSTDLQAIFHKVVLSRRGAYCFEVGCGGA